jgi:predicted metal-dependent hydrolase
MNAIGKFPPLEEAASAAPPGLAITPRDRRFAREGKPRWWMGGDPVVTAWYNSLSATFPRGEAFFVESVKAFRHAASPKLAREIRAFIAQEVNHSREHVAFNRAAIDAGYDLSDIDRMVGEWIAAARTRPAIVSLAATIALEHFTAMMAHEFLKHPRYLADADPESAALWRWHAVEEIEHKGVAYDTFLHATRGWSRWKRWKLKSMVMLLVTRDFVHNRIRDALSLLAQDGLTGWRVKARLLAYLFWSPGVLRRLLPAWLSYFLPGFHPWNHDDRALIAGYDIPRDAVTPA